MRFKRFLQKGDLTKLGVGGWTPPGIVANFLEALNVAGFSFPEAIVAHSVIVKAFSLPLMIRNHRMQKRLKLAQPELDHLQSELTGTKDIDKKRAIAVQLREAYAKHNCSPMQMLWNAVPQGVFAISSVLGIKRIADLPMGPMHTPFLWNKLDAFDPLYVMPVLSIATGAAMIMQNGEALQKTETKVMLSIGLASSLLFAHHVPMALWLYFLSNNVITIAQAFFIKKVLK